MLNDPLSPSLSDKSSGPATHEGGPGASSLCFCNPLFKMLVCPWNAAHPSQGEITVICCVIVNLSRSELRRLTPVITERPPKKYF